MSSATMSYTLQQIHSIANTGFHYNIPYDTVELINELSLKLGLTAHTIDGEFYQRDAPAQTSPENSFSPSGNSKQKNKKKNARAAEVSAEEWESIRSFQATKIEQKTGIAASIDQIRLFLNKLTDKTFLDMREKIVEHLRALCENPLTEDEVDQVSNAIYDIASTNKFYSRMYADLYAELVTQFVWLRPVFQKHWVNLARDQYNDIKYVDPDVDYDKFCEINKQNEKRKAVTQFYFNLASNGFISKLQMMKVLRLLLETVTDMIDQDNKKNEVDELTENIAILFNKDMLEEIEDDPDYDEDDFQIYDDSIVDTIAKLAKEKAKDHPSLSNKAIFKFMDLVDM